MMRACMSEGSIATQASTPMLRHSRTGALLALLTVLSALFYYKWGASLRVYDGLQTTGKLAVNPELLLHGGLWRGTLAYFGKIWPALVYGIVIGAVLRAAIPPSWIGRALGARGLKGSLVGGLAGAPLMLCSCCVTPIFTGLYERGARLSSSLAVMLAAPGFNLAALVLTFALLPTRLAVARVVCAIAIVLALPPLLSRLEADVETKASCAVVPTEPTEPRDFLLRFLRSLTYLVVVTVPLIVVGVVLGVLALPYVTHLAAAGAVVGVLLVALVSVVVALPTFFEIPIALVMTQLGAPPGVVLAVLVAGPIVNLPSLLVLGRETRPRLAVSLAAGVWGIASLAGILLSL
jgi:uncharacterized membrane protein YraQ (UPF0718 family)